MNSTKKFPTIFGFLNRYQSLLIVGIAVLLGSAVAITLYRNPSSGSGSSDAFLANVESEKTEDSTAIDVLSEEETEILYRIFLDLTVNVHRLYKPRLSENPTYDPQFTMTFRRETVIPAGIELLETSGMINKRLLQRFREASSAVNNPVPGYEGTNRIVGMSGESNLANFFRRATNANSNTTVVAALSNIGFSEKDREAMVYGEVYSPHYGFKRFYLHVNLLWLKSGPLLDTSRCRFGAYNQSELLVISDDKLSRVAEFESSTKKDFE